MQATPLKRLVGIVLRKIIAPFGYQIVPTKGLNADPNSQVEIPPSVEPSHDADLVTTTLSNRYESVLARYEVPILEPLEVDDYQRVCPPILPELKRVPPDFEVKVHRDLLDTVDNLSMRNYVRCEPRDDGLYLTDIYTNSHYYSRQRMLMSVYQEYFGGTLAGKSVVDVGCSSGYYCFYCSKLGADRVLGFDARAEHEEQFKLLHETLEMPSTCEYKNLDMEYQFESLEESFDVVLAMGTIYHVYDHARFVKNLFRICKGIVVLEGECSGHDQNWCSAHFEDVSNTRSGIYGPVVFPSVSLLIELLRWAGFKNVRYVQLPVEVEDRWGLGALRRAMLIAEK